MRIFLKIIKWISIVFFLIIVFGVSYVRFTRMLDNSFGGNEDSSYADLETQFQYEDIYFKIDSSATLHGVLFTPDSAAIIATIYHHLGQGLTANYTK